jgi:hypothetical protein
LHQIRIIITIEKESLERVLKYIDATIILHNTLIDMGCNDDKNAARDVKDEVLRN